MLHVSIKYNIPAATRAVVGAASGALAAATNQQHPELTQLACALEIARQIDALWFPHGSSRAADWADYPWLQHT